MRTLFTIEKKMMMLACLVLMSAAACAKVEEKDADGDGVLEGTDCNDSDASVRGPQEWFADADGDGYGAQGSEPESGCEGEVDDTLVTNDNDCDDTDIEIHPGQRDDFEVQQPEEQQVDNNCTGEVNENGNFLLTDVDMDGFKGDGSVYGPDRDCAPFDSAIHPDADEVCGDGRDNDCDMAVDEANCHGCTEIGCIGGWVCQEDVCVPSGDGTDPSLAVDKDGDGLSARVDCDDNDAEIGTNEWFADADGDGFGDPAVSTLACEQPEGFVPFGDDCDDGDADVTRPLWYRDGDGDGFGNPATDLMVEACELKAGLSSNDDDCNDGRDDVNPEAIEICDGADNDCDGIVDEGFELSWYCDADLDGHGAGDPIVQCLPPLATSDCMGYALLSDDCDDDDPEHIRPTWYRDADADGYGATDLTLVSDDCVAPEGYVASATDCDDADASLNLDDTDNDGFDTCAGDCDDADSGVGPVDEDEDGFSTCGAKPDCNDNNDRIHPEAIETCDGTDANCDGVIDDGLPMRDFCMDLDGDNDGDPATIVTACANPGDLVRHCGDCDDTTRLVHSFDSDGDGFTLCGEDGLLDTGDEDCDDMSLVMSLHDNDGDGVSACEGDCDDNNRELDTSDRDADGVSSCEGDCSDRDPARFPENPETCDGLDNDCDGEPENGLPVLLWYADRDGDGVGSGEVFAGCRAPQDGIVYVNLAGDCDDTDDGFVHPTWYRDADGDEWGSADLTLVSHECLMPNGYAPILGDCDDNNALLDPVDGDGDGYSSCEGDCRDTRDDMYPGAEEKCDGLDNDCDGGTDLGATNASTFYLDGDTDGFGKASSMQEACTAPAGHVPLGTDCNDTRSDIKPTAMEICDGLDNDCDGDTDEVVDLGRSTCGVGVCGHTIDNCVGGVRQTCDPFQGESDEMCDGLDNDCNGVTDDDALDGATYFEDRDRDGYGNTTVTSWSCEQPTGFVDNDEDCDDQEETRNPGMPEICNEIDDNCTDGLQDEPYLTFCIDLDGDGDGAPATGFLACEPSLSSEVLRCSDCDDTEDLFNTMDLDEDGFTTCGAPFVAYDCNDMIREIKPGAVESCDSIDNDCDGQTDEAGATGESTWYHDADRDTYGDPAVSVRSCGNPSGLELYVSTATDCYDLSDSIHPGAPEVCNGEDDNCLGNVDEGNVCIDPAANSFDADGDCFCRVAPCTGSVRPTFACPVLSGGDLNDARNDIYPSAPEVCDLVDNDQDGFTDEGEVCPSSEISAARFDDDGDCYCEGPEACRGTSNNQPAGEGGCAGILQTGDCDDGDTTQNPGAIDTCSGLNLDCNAGVNSSTCLGTFTYALSGANILLTINGDVTSSTGVADASITHLEVGANYDGCWSQFGMCGQVVAPHPVDGAGISMTFERVDFTPRVRTSSSATPIVWFNLAQWVMVDGAAGDGLSCAIGPDENGSNLIVNCN